MDALTPGYQPPIVPFFARGVKQPWIPHQRDGNRAPVGHFHEERVVRNLDGPNLERLGIKG